MNNPGTRGIFVTGTSTGVGKTVVSAALLRFARRQGVRCVGLKPVASGGERVAPGAPLRNADALELQAAGSVPVAYETVNPFCFEPAIAPHLAARDAGIDVRLDDLTDWYARATRGVDLAVVEGAGGWRVPLHPAGFLSDLPEALALDVVLVVGLTLGCLNHARLTAEAIERGRRCRLLGWVANAIEPDFARRADNVEALAGLLGSPPLAEVAGRHDASPSPYGHAVVDLPDTTRLRTALGLD